jgi:hypothetical protein
LGIAKVLDFGLAKVVPLAEQPRLEFTASHTAAGLVIGTTAYMSPEQALGHSTDERSDIFSLGVLLYEMATGRPAFTGATPMEVLDAVLHATPEPAAAVRRDMPAALSRVVEKALNKDPAQRYQDMSELAADLRRLAMPTSRIRRSVRTSALGASIAVIAALIWIAIPVPAVIDRVSIDDTTTSRHRETTSLPAYRAITEARGLYAANRWEAALESTRRAADLGSRSRLRGGMGAAWQALHSRARFASRLSWRLAGRPSVARADGGQAGYRARSVVVRRSRGARTRVSRDGPDRALA